MKHVKGVLRNERTKAMANAVAVVSGIVAAVVIPLSPIL